MTLVGVGTTAPGVTIAPQSVEDALKAQRARRDRDLIIGIGFQDKGELPARRPESANSECTVSRRLSIKTAYKNGDKGQPWATLQCTAKGFYCKDYKL
jgi:hypothetical protein